MSRFRAILGAVVVGTFVLASCGGSDGGDLFGKGSGGSGAAADASAGAGGASGAAGGGQGGEPAGGTAGVGGGVAGAAGIGGSVMGGASGMGAAGAAGTTGGAGGTSMGGASGSGAGGAAGGDATGVILCDFDLCPVGENKGCCVSETHGVYCYDEGSGVECQCGGVICSTLEIDCDGPEDCEDGELCCFEDGITSSRVRCRSSCDNGTTVDRDPLCRPLTANICTGSEQCLPDPRLPPGLFTCNPP